VDGCDLSFPQRAQGVNSYAPISIAPNTGRADADEGIVVAQIETAFEHGLHLRARDAAAELLRQQAGTQDGDGSGGKSRARKSWRVPLPPRFARRPPPQGGRYCGAVSAPPIFLLESHRPSAATAACAAAALESATITPASVSLRTCASRGCGSASVPVTDATMSGRISRPERNAARWPAGSGWPP